MRVAVPKESAPGERRVALVPETDLQAPRCGLRRPRRARRRDQCRICGRGLRGRRAQSWPMTGSLLDGAGMLACVASPTAEMVAQLVAGHGRRRLPRAADRRRRARAAARARSGRVRDGIDPPDHPRAVDGRALVAGDGVRLQGRAARRRQRSPPLPDAHDRRRDDRARAGARHRSRASRVCRRSRPRGVSAQSCPPSTSGRPSPSRCRASARPSSTSASARRRPRAATRAS